MYINKSLVVEQYAKSATTIFCGDDATDIDAAAMVKKLGGLVVVVANRASGGRLSTPDALLDLADIVVHNENTSPPQSELVALMHRVADTFATR